MISAVILTKNEEGNIKRCIKSLGFCDEIIVIDDESNDKTVKIAKKMGAQVFVRPLNKDFSKQRNFGLNKAKERWVLFIDADEAVPEKLAKEITKKLNDGPFYTGYFIERKDYMWGHEFECGETGSIQLLRLGRRGAGKWRREVHEVWDIRGKKGRLRNPILHYPHQNLSEFISTINKFSSIHGKANKNEGKKASILKVVSYPVLHFLKNFILRRGFQDKIYGFVHAVVMSFHSFLSWSKLWLIQRKNPG